MTHCENSVTKWHGSPIPVRIKVWHRLIINDGCGSLLITIFNRAGYRCNRDHDCLIAFDRGVVRGRNVDTGLSTAGRDNDLPCRRDRILQLLGRSRYDQFNRDVQPVGSKRVAVSNATPPFSAIVELSNASVTVGVPRDESVPTMAMPSGVRDDGSFGKIHEGVTMELSDGQPLLKAPVLVTAKGFQLVKPAWSSQFIQNRSASRNCPSVSVE